MVLIQKTVNVTSYFGFLPGNLAMFLGLCCAPSKSLVTSFPAICVCCPHCLHSFVCFASVFAALSGRDGRLPQPPLVFFESSNGPGFSKTQPRVAQATPPRAPPVIADPDDDEDELPSPAASDDGNATPSPRKATIIVDPNTSHEIDTDALATAYQPAVTAHSRTIRDSIPVSANNNRSDDHGMGRAAPTGSAGDEDGEFGSEHSGNDDDFDESLLLPDESNIPRPASRPELPVAQQSALDQLTSSLQRFHEHSDDDDDVDEDAEYSNGEAADDEFSHQTSDSSSKHEPVQKIADIDANASPGTGSSGASHHSAPVTDTSLSMYVSPLGTPGMPTVESGLVAQEPAAGIDHHVEDVSPAMPPMIPRIPSRSNTSADGPASFRPPALTVIHSGHHRKATSGSEISFSLSPDTTGVPSAWDTITTDSEHPSVSAVAAPAKLQPSPQPVDVSAASVPRKAVPPVLPVSVSAPSPVASLPSASKTPSSLRSLQPMRASVSLSGITLVGPSPKHDWRAGHPAIDAHALGHDLSAAAKQQSRGAEPAVAGDDADHLVLTPTFKHTVGDSSAMWSGRGLAMRASPAKSTGSGRFDHMWPQPVAMNSTVSPAVASGKSGARDLKSPGGKSQSSAARSHTGVTSVRSLPTNKKYQTFILPTKPAPKSNALSSPEAKAMSQLELIEHVKQVLADADKSRPMFSKSLNTARSSSASAARRRRKSRKDKKPHVDLADTAAASFAKLPSTWAQPAKASVSLAPAHVPVVSLSIVPVAPGASAPSPVTSPLVLSRPEVPSSSAVFANAEVRQKLLEAARKLPPPEPESQPKKRRYRSCGPQPIALFPPAPEMPDASLPMRDVDYRRYMIVHGDTGLLDGHDAATAAKLKHNIERKQDSRFHTSVYEDVLQLGYREGMHPIAWDVDSEDTAFVYDTSSTRPTIASRRPPQTMHSDEYPQAAPLDAALLSDESLRRHPADHSHRGNGASDDVKEGSVHTSVRRYSGFLTVDPDVAEAKSAHTPPPDNNDTPLVPNAVPNGASVRSESSQPNLLMDARVVAKYGVDMDTDDSEGTAQLLRGRSAMGEHLRAIERGSSLDSGSIVSDMHHSVGTKRSKSSRLPDNAAAAKHRRARRKNKKKTRGDSASYVGVLELDRFMHCARVIC